MCKEEGRLQLVFSCRTRDKNEGISGETEIGEYMWVRAALLNKGFLSTTGFEENLILLKL